MAAGMSPPAKTMAGIQIDAYVLSNMLAQFEHRFRIVDHESGTHLDSDLLGANNLALIITSHTQCSASAK